MAIRRKSFAEVLACVLLTFVGAARGASTESNWSVHVWQSEDGLPSNKITGVVQTKDGYLWAATDEGLAQFDGVRFQTFSPPAFAGGTSSKIGTMVRSAGGGLLMSLQRGPVVRLEPGMPPAIFLNGLPQLLPVSVAEDSDGSVWATFHTAVYRIKSGETVQMSSKDGLPSDKLECTLVEDEKGRVWFAQGGYVGIVADGRFHVLAQLTTTGTRIATARSGGMWVCSGSELYHCYEDGNLEDRGGFKPMNMRGQLTALMEDREGAVWIGTSFDGLFRYAGREFESVPTSHHHVTALAEDREGNLWVGTGGAGLDRIQPRAITLEGAETGLASESVQSLCEDQEGKLWTAAENGSLKCRSSEEETIVSDRPDWPGGGAVCLAMDAAGRLWIGTHNSRLNCLQDNHFTTFNQSNGLASSVITGMLPTKEGDLFLAEQGYGLQRLHSGRFIGYKLPSAAGRIRSMVQDGLGQVWVGTDEGNLYTVEGDQLFDRSALLGSNVKAIRSIYPSNTDNSLWIGVGTSGLGRLKDGRFLMLTTEQGLYDNTIAQIVADDRGWLWFGGARGIFRVREQDLNDVLDGNATRVQSVRYGENEGLPNLAATYSGGATAVRTHDGRLWMLMGTALVNISPDQLPDQMQPPPVLLEDVIADGRVLASYHSVIPTGEGVNLQNLSDRLKVPPDYLRLQFDFTALSFGAPTNVRFQYRLDGFDDHWLDAIGTQRTAAYPQLPAANYRFRVRACNSDGVWNEEGAALGFTVTPFVWQEWWFRLAVLGVFTSLVVAAARYVSFRRLQLRVRVLEQQTALDRERARIARDLHDDLGARLTNIVLLSDLSVREEDVRAAGRHVTEISSSARQIIKALDETVWAVHPRNDTLQHLVDYLGQLALEFLRAANIRCRVDLLEDSPPLGVSAEVRHNVLLVVKEALNNIVRHAGATEVWLRANVKGNSVCLTIEDNGSGFSGEPDDAFANGLINMRQRMEEIGGQFNLESEPGVGTRIFLTFLWRSK